MFIGRDFEIEALRTFLKTGREDANYGAITGLFGLFGAGKTTLLRQARAIIESEVLGDAIFVTNEDITATSLPEFVYTLATGFQSLDPTLYRLSLEETDSRRRRFLQIIGQLGADAMPVLRRLRSDQTSHGSTTADYGDRQLEAEAMALEVALKSQFNNRDDQRLTLDTGNVMAEALIVDLMTTFFPLRDGEDALADHIAEGKPAKKIVFIIDTFEKITPLVNPWLLESFLPYMFHKRFGDFQSYRSPYLPDRVFVRDFFDARFIIAGRERLSLTDYERRWDRYRDVLKEFRIGPFTEGELSEYLVGAGFPASRTAEVMALTQGLPYLVSLWVDAAGAGSNGTEGAFMNALAEQRIFWYKTPEQRDWIRAAAFLDWFDADALRCFSTIGESAANAYEYLRNASEVAAPSRSRPGKFELHEIIRSALRQATYQESGELAESFAEAAKAFYGASELLARFQPDDRHLLRKLAYFARFDDQALNSYFSGDAHLVRDFLALAPDIFTHTKYTRSLKSDALKQLKQYNRFADAQSYRRQIDRVREIWENRSEELNAEIARRFAQKEQIEARLRELNAQTTMKAQLQGSAQRGVQGLESELGVAKRQWFQRLSPRDSLVARTSFFLLVFFLLLVFFADLIPVEAASQDLIRTASLVMALLFLAVFSLMLGRILYMRSRRREHEATRDDVVSVETRLLNKQYELQVLAAEAGTANAEIQALKQQLLEIAAETAELRERLKEPYF